MKHVKSIAIIKLAAKIIFSSLIIVSSINLSFIWLQSHYIKKAAREGAKIAASSENPTIEHSRDNDRVKKAVITNLGGLYPHMGSYTPEDCCGCDDPAHRICAIKIEPATTEGISGYKVSVTVKIFRIFDVKQAWGLPKLFPENRGNQMTATAFGKITTPQKLSNS